MTTPLCSRRCNTTGKDSGTWASASRPGRPSPLPSRCHGTRCVGIRGDALPSLNKPRRLSIDPEPAEGQEIDIRFAGMMPVRTSFQSGKRVRDLLVGQLIRLQPCTHALAHALGEILPLRLTHCGAGLPTLFQRPIGGGKLIWKWSAQARRPCAASRCRLGHRFRCSLCRLSCKDCVSILRKASCSALSRCSISANCSICQLLRRFKMHVAPLNQFGGRIRCDVRSRSCDPLPRTPRPLGRFVQSWDRAVASFA